MRLTLILTLLLVLTALPAAAATRTFTWTYGGKNFVEGETEAQEWVSVAKEADETDARFWYNLGAVWGLTERVELATWIIPTHTWSSPLRMRELELDARIQLWGSGWGDPDKPGLALDVAQSLRMDPLARHGSRLLLAWEQSFDKLRYALNLGGRATYGHNRNADLAWAAGVAYHALPLLEVGGEAFGWQRLYSSNARELSEIYVGPLVNLLVGRVWWATQVGLWPAEGSVDVWARSNIGIAF